MATQTEEDLLKDKGQSVPPSSLLPALNERIGSEYNGQRTFSGALLITLIIATLVSNYRSHSGGWVESTLTRKMPESDAPCDLGQSFQNILNSRTGLGKLYKNIFRENRRFPQKRTKTKRQINNQTKKKKQRRKKIVTRRPIMNTLSI